MDAPFRLRALGRTTKILLVLALLVVTFVAAFDWNWLRGPVEHYLVQRSNREVRIGHLEIEMAFSLEPTIRLRDLYVENASWAAQRPLARAGELAFTISLRSLWQGRPVISKLVLVDADIDMERQANGLRNWRLKNPDDRSPGTLTVQSLEAHRSQVRFVNRAIDLDLTAVAAPADHAADMDASAARERPPRTPASPAAAPGRPAVEALPTRITYKGTYEGVDFSGEALTSNAISFRESGLSFPVRGHIASRNTRLDFDGFFTDVFDLGPMDAKLQLVGPTLAHVHPFLRIRPPPSRPYRLEAQLTQTNKQYKFAALRGKVGETDIAGEATYDRSNERPLVLASLRSEAADLADLSALVGLHYAPQAGAKPRAKADASKAESANDSDNSVETRPEGANRIFPSRAFRLDRLRALDAHVRMNAKKLKSQSVAPLESLNLVADLHDGVLELKTLDVGVAGGHLTGSVAFDAHREVPSARATIDLRDIRLQKLVPSLAAPASGIAPVRGRIALSGEGKSIAAVLANATGSLAARIDGGRISNLADAKLGLNIGKVLSLMIRGDRSIDLHCGAIGFDLHQGIGKSKTIVVDTQQTRTEGIGTVDLRRERWDILLTPQPKNPGLLTRHASIRTHGTFRSMQVAIQERVVIGRNGASGSSDLVGNSACDGVTRAAAAENNRAPSAKERAADAASSPAS